MSHPATPPALGERSLRRVVSISEALFFTPDDPVPSERLTRLSLDVSDFLARAGRQTRTLIRLSLWLVSLAAPLFATKLSTLSRLPVEERVRALSKLEKSALGAPLLAVKALLCLLYYEDPDAARAIGFDGTCLEAHASSTRRSNQPDKSSDGAASRAENQDAHGVHPQRR